MQNIVILKTQKSEGIAMLLVFLFGPVGMFYATVRGALTMLFVVPIVAIGLLFLFLYGANSAHSEGNHGLFTVFAGLSVFTLLFIFLGYWIICLIWSYRAVRIYNEDLQFEQDALIRKQSKENQKRESENNDNDASLINQLDQLTFLKERGVLTAKQHELKSSEIKDKLLAVKNTSSVNQPLNAVKQHSVIPVRRSNTSTYIALIITVLVISISIFFLLKDDIKTSSENKGFNKTEFANRNEELEYVREYLKVKLPELIIKVVPEKIAVAKKQALSEFGKNYTSTEIVDIIIKTQQLDENVMSTVIERNLSFKGIKIILENVTKEQFIEFVANPKREKNSSQNKTKYIPQDVQDNGVKEVVSDEILNRLFASFLYNVKTEYKEEYKNFDVTTTTVLNFLKNKYPSEEIDAEIISLSNGLYVIEFNNPNIEIRFDYNSNTKEFTLEKGSYGD